ncbi:MAG: hypothetical protein D6681_22075 [Calditrichaeota bacterium]|nr:MAG: hypothetical protein D6681_22075 [Calditrichota bacterium]
MQMRHFHKLKFILPLIVIALGAGAWIYLRQGPDIVLPTTLQGIPLHYSLTGKEAAEALRQMHGKSVVPAKNAIGVYEEGRRRVILYISSFPSPSAATDRLHEMAEEIGEGSSGFGHHTDFTVGQQAVHQVLGYGQVHYFFARDHFVYWLSVDADLAQPALAELLQVNENEIPVPFMDRLRER